MAPFTTTTWADFPQGLNARTEMHWPNQSDLAHELQDLTSMDLDRCSMLISASLTGNPIVLTWNSGTEQTTTTVIVTALHVHPSNASANRIRVQYWGFGHDIWLPKIISASFPELTLTNVDTEAIA
ncbi:hypothetical protein NONI108955_11105 [Nocardia ninae]|uniref:Uncharacterized protein n=1 Tax=Nocardia ninae NBRC 108245 TaxID=1210091 RepID=A0A511MMW1_9NOCA|nr:hypothetical protein NN4_64710 [Nocardia ninae NBRC 108245]